MAAIRRRMFRRWLLTGGILPAACIRGKARNLCLLFVVFVSITPQRFIISAEIRTGNGFVGALRARQPRESLIMDTGKRDKLDPLEVTKEFVSRSAQRASVYVCCAPSDEPSARRFSRIFESRNTPCWFVARDMASDAAWPQSAIEAIESSKFFIVLLSAQALIEREILAEIKEAIAAGSTILVLQSTQSLLDPQFDELLTSAHTLAVSDPLGVDDVNAAWKKIVEIESNSTWEANDANPHDEVGPDHANSYLIEIEVLRGKLSGQTSCQLGEDERLVFGRGSEADVRIDDDRASRRHAGLVVRRDPRYGLELYMMDLMSRNGTWVRYRRDGDTDISKYLEQSQVRITTGAIIRIGSSDFRITAVRVPAQLARVGS